MMKLYSVMCYFLLFFGMSDDLKIMKILYYFFFLFDFKILAFLFAVCYLCGRFLQHICMKSLFGMNVYIL